MTRITLAVVLALLPIVGMIATRGRSEPAAARHVGPPPADLVRAGYVATIDSLAEAIRALPTASPRDTAAARASFRRARRAYKRVEYLIADRLPDAEIALNGPPLPRPHESVIDAVIPPTGLQVIEAALFDPSPTSDSVLASQDSLLAPTLAALRAVQLDQSAADGRFFDAVRQEIARVSTLGLAGFDATITHDGIIESAEALGGVRQGLGAYRPASGAAFEAWAALDRRLDEAIASLESHPDFERFDRLAFITGQAAPVAEALTRLQSALGIARTTRPTAWYTTANTVFDSAAVSAFDYAPSDAAPLRADIIDLGRRLFADPRLSAGNRRACATCHDPARAFTDGRPTARVDPGLGTIRNVPTLLNAALQPFQLADQRAHALEDQIAVVLANPREMNLPLDAAVAKLEGDTTLAGAFAAAYGVPPPARAITARRLQTTLAAFVRSLAADRSRADLALAGDTAALNGQERFGFDVFMGKAACGTCHFLPTFGGTLPPALLESEPEVIGVPSRPVTSGARIDPDPGVAGFDHVPLHRHAFKTPSLRNVALTAPYMHNGVFRTLDEVVDFYDRGGGAGIGIELPNQTLSPEPLHLSRAEKRALVAFMRALSGTSVSGER